MKGKNNNKIFAIINDFKKILIEKPPLTKMKEELRMMRFKIHPINGDINGFDFNNQKLIEVLWSFGKLDDLYEKKYKKLSPFEKKLFIKTLTQIVWQLEEQLKQIKLVSNEFSPLSSFLEIEVYKEKPKKN